MVIIMNFFFFLGDYVPIDLLTKIAPRESDKTEVSLVQKAADGVTVGASLGPWLIKHREAGSSSFKFFPSFLL